MERKSKKLATSLSENELIFRTKAWPFPGLIDPEDPDRPGLLGMRQRDHLAVLVDPEADVVGNLFADDQPVVGFLERYSYNKLG